MRKLLILFILLLGCGVYLQVEADSSISADEAILYMPTPTFDDVHLAYFRITANEAPFTSLADQDGILQSLLYGGGGRRWAWRGPSICKDDFDGCGYGLDYVKLMRRMIAHSPRTFPANSKFLVMSDAKRTHHRRRQSKRNLWSSTLKLDCSEPSGWAQFSPKRKNHWSRLYGKRCRAAVRSTELLLKGLTRTRCDGQPTTWGNDADTTRPGGPLDGGWKEIFCDRVPPTTCDLLSGKALLNSKVCAKNRFWTWLIRFKK